MKKNHHLIWDNLSRIISVFKKSSINNRHFYGIGLMGMLILSLFSYKAEQSKQALVDRIIYVDQNALGSDNGTTWANAYLTLTEALADARSTNDEVEIWVADGIYFPDEGTNIVDADGNASAANNSNATFLVDRDGINIYGGFMGGEGSRMFIDPSTNLTILSGDIDANDTKNGDGITEAVSDQSGTNAKTILTIKDISSPSLSNTLEGLVFTAATETAVVINEETNAESITVNLSENSFIGNEGEMGGAVQIISSTGASVNTTISNSTFKSNNADNGGAIYVETNSAASMITLTDLELESNSSSNTGGALYYLADDANASSLNLTRVDFKTNEASDNGGAFYFENDGGEVDVDIMDSDFTENESTDDGGAIYLYNFDDDNTDTDFTLEEVNFTTNMSGAGGGAIFTNADGGEKLSFGLTTVTFEGNFTDDSEGGAIYFDLAGMNLNPTFEDVLFKNNTGSEGGAIYIDFDSQTFGGSFSNVTFDGNTGETGGAIYLDGDAGNFTTNVSNTVFTGNSSENEGGALYFESESGGTATASFTDVEFNGNKTLDGEGGAIYFNIEGGSNQSTFTNVLFNRNKAKDDSDADETIGNGGALYINADGGDAGMVFENCIFDSNKSEHVTYDDGDADKQPAFINSTFYGASNSAIYIEAFDSGQTPIDFTNCIFWNNNQDVVSFNNSKVNVGSDGELVNINFSITEEATNFFSPGQNNLFENPLFVDAPNGDFNLQQLSPAIDEGDDSALNTASDFDGNDRVLGCAVDMGALESLFKTVFAGEDKTVCACEFIQLEGTRAGDAMTVIWSGGDGEFDDPTDPQTLYYPTESELNSGTITLRLTSTKPGCTNLFDEVTFTIDDLVDIDKECDGTFDISWLQIDGDNPLDVVEWNVAIRDNDVFLKQYNNLTSPEILVTEGTLVPGAEYFIQIEEVYSNGAVSTTCILPPVDNATPLFDIDTDNTFGPQCNDGDILGDVMNGQLTFTLTQPTFATCEDATFNVYIDNEPFDLTAINDAELIAGGPYGFDDVIQVMGLGEGMHYIALEVVDADGCFFTESKCLAVGREIIDLQVNDTKTPKLSVTIDDPVIGQTTVVGNGPADEANENTKTIDLGTIDTGADCCFTVDFLIEAEDNCDGFPVVTATSTGNVTRSEVIEDVGNPQAGMFEGAIKVIFCPGQSSVTLTSTDENGNTSSITYLVKIEDKPVVIDLQASTFYVGVCESDIGFNYSFLIIDPCNTITTVSPFTTGGSLAPFEDMSQRVIEKIGNSLFVQVVFMDVPEDDYNFNVTFDNTLASVPISVVPLSESNFKDLSCNDDVNVSLGDDCASVVTADMVLEGTNLCNDNFVIDITYDAQNWESNRISRKGTYVYEAFTIDNKFICQGRITGVDNDDPTYPREIFDAVVTCDDIDTLLALSDDELLRTRIDDICFFDGKSWDILEAQNAFFIDDITDNCSDYCELIFDISDNFVSGDLCAGERMIERTINVTDAHGNTSTFIVRFIAEQPELLFDEIEDQTLDLCLGDYDLTETGQPYYYSYCLDDEGERIKVYPTFDETNTSRFCGFILSFEDTEFPEECGGIKLIRNWTYIDECENPNELQEIEEQIIKLDYLTPPDVSCDPDFPDVISTSGIDCLADYIFPAPIVDGCIGGSWDYNIKLYQIIPELNERGRPTGDSIEVLATYPITRLDGGSYTVTGLEVGKYRISYQVVTECGVVTEPIYCPFDVKDLVEPVVVLNDELNVAIGGENIAKVCLQDVDEGSKDNCELVDLKIRRELWDEACRQSYIEQVLGVSSLDDLIKEDLGDGQAVWYRVEGGINRVDLVVLELTKDGLQYFSAWQECVLFTCCDVTSAVGNYTVVEARAEDKHGNVNTNWMKVTIENKIIPRCIAPDPITLECIDLTEMEAQDINFVRSRFGTAQELIANNELIIDFNCTVEVEDTISWMAGDCSEGMLTRIFTVYAPDGSGINTSTCEQKINIERVIDYQIKFPADYQETCQGDGGEDLEIETYGCDIFAIYRDTVDFEVFEDFCFRRYVTYSVVNWCEYDGVTEEPTIIVRDIDCDDDTFECTWFRNDRGNVYIDDDDNPKDDPIVFWRRGDDSYDSGECDLGGQPYEITPGFWEYTQSIEVFDNTAPEIDVDTFDFCAFGASGAAACRGEVWVPYTVKDICTKEVETRSVLISIDGAQAFDARNDLYTIVDEGDGRFAVMSMPDVGIPEGNHTFVITVADKCGNVQTRETPFTVTDCKTPSPLCYAELTVDLFPLVENEEIVGGMNSFPAVDFIAISSQDCNPHPNADPLEDGENEVRYYAVRQDEIVAAGLDLPTADYLTDEYRAVDFTCFDEGRVIVVFVIGEDGLGNFDFCTINVTVDQGQDPCDGLDLEAARIAGSITSEKGDPVADVEVTLSGSMSQKLTTNNSGNYFFDGIILGNDYTVTPNLDQDYSNGVSTFDLVLITKHILGVSDFDTPYKLIAADVNNSGSITTLDLIQLRKMILSISDEFSNNTSWRFIPVDHQFANPAQPWNTIFPEFINLNNLDDDVLTADFMAVKVGDVNGSVSPNGLVSSIRNFKGTFPISAEDAIMQQNETYEVSLSAKAIKQVEGFQFTLSFDVEKIELVDIQHSLLKDENIGLRYVEDGFITVSWNGTNSQFDEELFTLSFKAKSSVQLSKVLNVSSRFTAAEAYANNGNLNNIAFEFDGQALIQDKVELYQNIPNPFNNTTTIGFYLPEATGVNILFRDANGRILHQLNGNYSKGKNQIQINKKDLGSGVIYYTLESGAFVITKRMLVL